MDQMVKEVLSALDTQFMYSMLMNIVAFIFAMVILFVMMNKVYHNDTWWKIIKVALVILGLVVLVILLNSIFVFSDAIQTLKETYETLIYNTGSKSV
jgi:hypothetical protein